MPPKAHDFWINKYILNSYLENEIPISYIACCNLIKFWCLNRSHIRYRVCERILHLILIRLCILIRVMQCPGPGLCKFEINPEIFCSSWSFALHVGVVYFRFDTWRRQFQVLPSGVNGLFSDWTQLVVGFEC